MYDLGYQKNRMDEIIPHDVLERRTGAERRKASARGFTYISTVGWICRREQSRRKDDRDGIVGREP
jgi:hypothetical protein